MNTRVLLPGPLFVVDLSFLLFVHSFEWRYRTHSLRRVAVCQYWSTCPSPVVISFVGAHLSPLASTHGVFKFFLLLRSQ
ncbi:hypothetical protein B0H14DRAFT_1513869 [Mycena olivaceomarginata]|nr:hypothetical protein B0H14DRAFT_873847 [Mycena olivaceomarginata]KAJ7881280.1 hypothetical protein B0H14DRAFT_1513869 [Mycena olivaceomarginata]